MDELLPFTLTSPPLHFRQTGSSPQFSLTSSTLTTNGQALTIYIDEPSTAYHIDGLLPTTLIDELSPQHRWTSSYYLRLMSPPLHFRQTGSSPQFSLTSSPLNTDGRALSIYIDEPSTALQTDGLLPTILIDELSPQHRWTSSYYLRLTSPPLHFRQTGSSPQFSLTSSPLNTDGRALTIYVGEPSTALQTDGILPTILINELYPQHRWTSSYYLRLTSPPLHFRQTGSSPQFSLTSSPLNTDGRALTIYVDKPSTALQTDGHLPTILVDELSPQHRWTSSYYLH